MIYEFDGMVPVIDRSAYVSDSAVVIGNVTIGRDCYVGPGAIIRTDDEANPIIIENYSAVEDGVIIHVGGARGGCLIQEHVTIGHGAIVHGIKLGHHSNVGMGAILSIYSEIGEYSVVAEGAVVKKWQVIPARVVVGGTPAEVLRELSEHDIDAWEKSNAWYVELARKCSTPGVLKRVE